MKQADSHIVLELHNSAYHTMQYQQQLCRNHVPPPLLAFQPSNDKTVVCRIMKCAQAKQAEFEETKRINLH